MVEKARRSRVDGGERGNPTRQWEVFVRHEESNPMRHVGSVAAASGAEAHERASRLFGWFAADVWCCPADEVERFSTRGLASEAADESADVVSDDREGDDDGDEPRVYEETEGTPEVYES